MTAREYADLLIAESKKPELERTFTIAHVPVKMRGEVGHLLRKEYGGNESDKKLGEVTQKVAIAIPGFVAGVQTIPGVYSILANPVVQKYVADAAVGVLGGKIADKIIAKDSNGKYDSVGEYVYNASGLRKATEGTALEEIARNLSEMTNPGYYVSAWGKPFINVGAEFASRMVPGPTALKHRYTRQNINDAVKDVLNYTKTDKATEPILFEKARQTGQKSMARNTPAYTTTDGVLVDFPDKPVFKNNSNTAAITKLDDHTYSLRLSPEQGQTLSLADRKQVLNWVNDLPRHSYISGDYSSLPQGQVFTNMLNEGNLGAFIKNYIWPSKGPLLNTSGMSPDAYEYVAKLAKRPGYSIRYMPEPMTSFNSLGAHGKNKAIYDGWVSSLTGDRSTKQAYIKQELNPWLENLGVEQLAYLDTRGNIIMPHISAYKNRLGGKIKMAK